MNKALLVMPFVLAAAVLGGLVASTGQAYAQVDGVVHTAESAPLIGHFHDCFVRGCDASALLQ